MDAAAPLNVNPPAAPRQAPSGPRSLPLPGAIVRALRAVSRRQFRVQAGQFPLLLAAILPAFWILRALADRFLNLGWSIRLVLLLVDAAIFGILAWFFLIQPLRRRLDLRGAALLVERRNPQFRTSLVSAVELAAAPHGARSLVEGLLRDVGRRLVGQDIARVTVPARPLTRWIKWAALSVFLAGGLYALFLPVSGVLAVRLFLSRVPLPTQTTVAAISRDATIPLGSDFELAARAKGIIPRSGRIVLRFQDGRRETLPLAAAQVEPEVFHTVMRNVRQPFRYRFELNDGVGETWSVGVKVTPTLRETQFTQVYPAYTGLGERAMPGGGLSLLAGGTLRIQAIAAQPLKSASLELQGLDRAEPLEIQGEGRDRLSYELPIPAEGLTGLALHLVDEHGEASVNDPVYRVSLLTDRPPTASLTLPRDQELTVLPGARVKLAFSVRDDFGIKTAGIRYQVFRPSAGTTLEPAENGRLAFDPATPVTSLTRHFEWDLATLIPPLPIGGKVSYWVEAEDTSSAREAPSQVTSSGKSLLIVSEEQKRQELLEALDQTADRLEHIYDAQRKLSEKTDATLGGQ